MPTSGLSPRLKPRERITDTLSSAALKSHPDRVPASSPDRESRTRRFQLVNDAYYTLSDPTRRRDYDLQRRRHPAPPGADTDPFAEEPDTSVPGAGDGGAQNAYSWARNFFTGQGQAPGDREQAENQQFGDVFEEMLREEGMADQGGSPTRSFWSILGGVSGGALGFIVANMPGMLAGAVAGNRLGAVRDARGKSVYAVFLVGCAPFSGL